MIDLSPAQAADRISKLLAASESRTLDFERISAQLLDVVRTVGTHKN